MLLLTMAWYYCVARNLEFLLVEQPKAPSETTQRFWMSRNYVQNVLATCQFLGSDALIVSPNTSPSPRTKTLTLVPQLFRAYIICGRRWPFITLPLAIYISFLGVGITINLVPLSTQFGGTLPLPPVHALATAFHVLSAALNLITTAIITFTLLQQDGRGHKYGVSGDSITTVTILAESAAFYAACAVVFVVLFQVGSPMQSWFGALNNCSAVRSSRDYYPICIFSKSCDAVPQPRLDHPPCCPRVVVQTECRVHEPSRVYNRHSYAVAE
jgi:hypothetical protein